MNPINIIMKVAKIEDHLSDKEMNDILKEHKDSYNIYRRILLIKMVKNGDTIKNASKIVAVSRKTGERWVKEYNEKGIDGLLPDYSNCGLESELTDEMLEILHYYITHTDKGYTIKDVQDLIYGLFKIKFSYNHTWFITRKKLELNYGKPFIRYNARTKEDMELFKKN